MKKVKKVLGLLISCVMAVQFVACGNKTEVNTGADSVSNMPEKIRLGYFQVPNDELIAMSEDLYGEMGCEVEAIEFTSGKDINNALASNSIDLGYMGTVPAASGIASGLNYEVCWIHAILNDIECLIAKNDSGISSVADLKDKKVAVVIGSTSHYSLLSAMKDAGLSERDITILNGSPAEINAMWQRGDIDAAYIWEPTLSNFKDDGKILFTGVDGERIGAVTGTVEVVNKDFGAKYPQAVADYLSILEKAKNMYKDDKEKVLKDVGTRLEISPEAAEIQLEGSKWLTMEEQLSDGFIGTKDSKGKFSVILKNTGDFLAEQGSISESPLLETYENAINPSYLELAQGK